MSTPSNSPSAGATLRRLAAQARPFRGRLILLFAISLFNSPMALLQPVPFKLIVDCVLGDRELPAIFRAMLPDGAARQSLLAAGLIASLLVLIAVIKHLAEMGYGLLRTWCAEKLVMEFRARLFRHVQRLSLTYHDTKGAADAAYRIQYDAPAIQWVLIDAVVPLGTAFITLGTMIWVLLRIDWILAVVALIVVPALYIATKVYGRRIHEHWREARDLESAAHSVIHEVLNAVRVVKAFSAEDREQARFERRAGRTLREHLRVTAVSTRFAMVIGLTMAAGTAIVLLLGAMHVQQGILTLGDLVLVMSYLALLYTPLGVVAGGIGSLQGSLACANRAFELLDEDPEVVEKTNARPLARARGQVEFQDVSFAYTGGRAALHEVSFRVEPGARVGIAGHTGAGKSTLVSLLLRLYDPAAGSIRLDGNDLRDYVLRDLRNQFSIVLQEPVLFSASIGDNIAYARPEATQDEIIAAAKAANAHDFIMATGEGYDTPVGERGHQLSGGERQRISLARAFLKDAPILILDEPTSSVDVATEAVIMEGMRRLMAGRTTFMIAHRLTTLDLCDVRLELAGGRLTRVSSPPPG